MEITLAAADKQFIDLLYRALASPSFEAGVAAVQQEQSFQQRFNAWVGHGVWDEKDVASAEALYREQRSGYASLTGRAANAIRELGLAFAGPDRDRLAHIPLVLMPTGALNARVFSAPSGLPILVLNQGFIALAQMIISAILSYISWHDDEPFCRDAPQSDYGAAIVALAAAVASSDPRVLLPHRKTLRFESLGEFNRDVEMWLELIEGFVLLHEYGHILGGHLVAPSAGRATDDIPASEYSRSHVNEFEADQYAVERFLQVGGSQLRSTDVAFNAGLLLRFYALVERMAGRVGSDSHPPAIDRWARIKTLTSLDASPEALAHRLDGGFGVIEASLDNVSP